jgi:hypothetical protein
MENESNNDGDFSKFRKKLVEIDEKCLNYDNEIKQSKEDRKELFNRSDVKNNKLDEIIKSVDYLKNDNILIKNAVGVKNKENGERDAQIEAIKDLTTKLEKKTHEEDNNISDNVNVLALEFAEIKGLLTAYFNHKNDEKEAKRNEFQDKQVNWNDRWTGRSVVIAVYAIGITIILSILILMLQHFGWI